MAIWRKTDPAQTGIARAVLIAGGQRALARCLNADCSSPGRSVTQQAVSLWVRQGYAPLDRALAISACVNGRVPPLSLLHPQLAAHLVSMLPWTAAPPIPEPESP